MKNQVFIYKKPEQNTPGNRDGYKVVIWQADYLNFHMASFETIEQFANFCKKFNILLKPHYESESVEVFETNKLIREENIPFMSLAEIPKGAKKWLLYSNGSVVVGYYKNTKDKLLFYRPNPNAKSIYKPVGDKQRKNHQKKFGSL